MDILSYFGPLLVSGIVGALVAALELITSKYPRTYFLLLKEFKLWAYILAYGVLSLFLMLFFNLLVNAEVIKLEGIGISNVWVQAIFVGVSTRAFLHIRLVKVSVGSQSFPIGIETFMYLFEPWLLRGIELDEFNAVREFIDKSQGHYTDLNVVKQKIGGNIPPNLPEDERIAFLRDMHDKRTVPEAMELYLIYFGKKSFERVFPI